MKFLFSKLFLNKYLFKLDGFYYLESVGEYFAILMPRYKNIIFREKITSIVLDHNIMMQLCPEDAYAIGIIYSMQNSGVKIKSGVACHIKPCRFAFIVKSAMLANISYDSTGAAENIIFRSDSCGTGLFNVSVNEMYMKPWLLRVMKSPDACKIGYAVGEHSINKIC